MIIFNDLISLGTQNLSLSVNQKVISFKNLL